MCHEFHVVLDFVFWVGLFVLEERVSRYWERGKEAERRGVFGAKHCGRRGMCQQISKNRKLVWVL